MNIFVLHQNPKIASIMHLDKHIIKMPLETAQMLCTIHWLSGNSAPYKATHKNHPCTLWIKESIENYNWLCELGINLCKEYTFRYNKIHKCEEIIRWCIDNKPNLPNIQMTYQPLAMPNEYKISKDPVECYRKYYINGKSHLHSWKNREKPFWIQ